MSREGRGPERDGTGGQTRLAAGVVVGCSSQVYCKLSNIHTRFIDVQKETTKVHNCLGACSTLIRTNQRQGAEMMDIYHIYQLWDLLIKFMYALDVSREPKLDGRERRGVGQWGYMRAKNGNISNRCDGGGVRVVPSSRRPFCRL